MEKRHVRIGELRAELQTEQAAHVSFNEEFASGAEAYANR